MDLRIAGFDWDDGNREKCRGHGVGRSDIEALFGRPIAVFPSVHAKDEARFKAIGTNAEGRHIFVVFTLRRRAADTFIRPIGARYMHEKEVSYYEKQTAEAEKAARPENG